MKKIKILKYPNPILRKPSRKIPQITAEIKRLALDMKKIMEANDGIGLAAPQVGQNLRLIVVNLELDPEKKPKLKIFYNPEITKRSEERFTQKEGCLSFPNLYGDVIRHKTIEVRALNFHGKKQYYTCKNLIASVFQHEIDHLDGILLIDRALPGTLEKIKPEITIRKVSTIFCGGPQFSEIILKYLLKQGLPIKSVITTPDKKAGRGLGIVASPTKLTSKTFKLPIFQPKSKDQFVDILKQQKPDLVITAASGFIVPESGLAIPKYGIINIHPSLLPKYRGPSPISSAILAGEKTTGATIFKIDKVIDHGPIIAQKKVKIKETDTAKSLSTRLAKASAKLLLKVLPKYVTGKIKLIPQDDSKVTFTKQLNKEIGEINWSQKPDQIERHIRAMQPWPQAYTYIRNKRLIIKKAHLQDKKLVLDEVQLEGKKPLPWGEFKNGLQNQKPKWLSKVVI